VARKQRMHYSGALYHVMARGNNGEYVLKKPEDKKKYIHRNPVEANITKDANYEWSSYSKYIREKADFVDTSFVLNILSHNKVKARAGYKKNNSAFGSKALRNNEYRISE